MRFARQRRMLWHNASRGMLLASVTFLVVGVTTGTGILVALAIPCGVLIFAFERRKKRVYD